MFVCLFEGTILENRPRNCSRYQKSWRSDTRSESPHEFLEISNFKHYAFVDFNHVISLYKHENTFDEIKIYFSKFKTMFFIAIWKSKIRES